MIVTLQTAGLQTLAQVRAFVEGNEPVSFTLTDRTAAHLWMTDTLKRFRYMHCTRTDKGLLRRYLAKVTGLSRAQLTRAITQFCRAGVIEDRRRAPAKPLARRYTAEDVRLLAETDALHGTLSGPAIRKLCERMHQVFGDARFERLARISNGHLYNLRQHKTYRTQRGSFDKTRPVHVQIGERRKPTPQGKPGYLRIDSVHQGDLDGIKGLYLIHAVDEVTPFQAVFATAKISEHFLVPVLTQLLNSFPFTIQGFHTDNGSEYINKKVAKLLEKLRIEQTKSRARKTNDNALVESKNGSTLRKHLGYSHIPGRFAAAVNRFTSGMLTEYLNFHRPCHFPTESVDAKGKLRKHYRYQDMMTPYEKWKSLPQASEYLKPGITFQPLDAIANRYSDNEAAQRLNQARAELFQLINQSQTNAA
ncbi:DDE-type integrase/transposase/recombinase [Methylococcus geothermalis]|uniref:DDE-type integrase/transposase/recombinase n=1 Tax=Methylococcus geothermalis TaxID=2681310 RepID=A0A858Q5D1_9GAMM|nr:DDE-type integrase/transposase/recombinase [Methylococcus geothermalis]